MIAALFYLQYHSFRNRLVSRFKRLKQPKYLIGALVGGFYFYCYFYRYIFQGFGGQPAMNLAVSPEHRLLFELAGRAGALRHRAAGVARSPRTRRAHVHRGRSGVSVSRARHPAHSDSLQTPAFAVGNFFHHTFFHAVFPAIRRQRLDSCARLVADSFDAQSSLPRLLICPDAAAGSRHFQPAPAAAGLRAGGGDGRFRLGLGQANAAGTGSRGRRQSQCDYGLRATGFDRRPRVVSAVSVPAGGAAVSRARRGGVFRRADAGVAALFASLPLGHLFRRGLRGSLGGSFAETGRAHRRHALRQLAGREEKSKGPASVVQAGRHRPARHGAALEKSHRRRPGVIGPPLDYSHRGGGRRRRQPGKQPHRPEPFLRWRRSSWPRLWAIRCCWDRNCCGWISGRTCRWRTS